MKNIDFYDTIFKRKSVRKFEEAPLSSVKLSEITDFFSSVKPLYDIKTELRIIEGELVKAIFKTAHFIIILSEKKDGYLTNAGFIMQQIDLFLSASGIGSCYIGLGAPGKQALIDTNLEYCIMLAIGTPIEPIYRKDISEFNRKSINNISNLTEANELIEAARFAPSATNSQPWYFEVTDGYISVYCAKLNRIKALMYEKMNKIDIGIALCHMKLAADHYNQNIEFINNEPPKIEQPKGYYYITTVKIS